MQETKQEISQPFRNLSEISQPFRKQFASLAKMAKFASHSKHCSLAKKDDFASHIHFASLAKFR